MRMLDRVKMNVVQVVCKIIIITDFMFPKPTLPNVRLPAFPLGISKTGIHVKVIPAIFSYKLLYQFPT